MIFTWYRAGGRFPSESRNARLRYAGCPQTTPDPLALDVEGRDLALYDTLAGAVVEVAP